MDNGCNGRNGRVIAAWDQTADGVWKGTVTSPTPDERHVAAGSHGEDAAVVVSGWALRQRVAAVTAGTPRTACGG